MSTLTATRVNTLPRVNLLPPEIEERRRLRRLKGILGAGVLASAGVVGLLYVVAANDAADAADQLAATQATNVTLQAEAARYASVPATLAKIDAAELQRTQAMSQEVRWSYYLNDLSLRIPRNVWLTQVAVTQNVDTVATAAAPGTYATPGIGNLTFEGKAYSHNDVANWLEMLARQKGFVDAAFSKSVEDEQLRGPSGKKAVTFSSTVTVTEDALSRRYVQKAGS